MPIPSRKLSEPKDKYIQRCMSNPVMLKEYPDQAQRAAICYQKAKGSIFEQVVEQLEENKND